MSFTRFRMHTKKKNMPEVLFILKESLLIFRIPFISISYALFFGVIHLKKKCYAPNQVSITSWVSLAGLYIE